MFGLVVYLQKGVTILCAQLLPFGVPKGCDHGFESNIQHVYGFLFVSTTPVLVQSGAYLRHMPLCAYLTH